MFMASMRERALGLISSQMKYKTFNRVSGGMQQYHS